MATLQKMLPLQECTQEKIDQKSYFMYRCTMTQINEGCCTSLYICRAGNRNLHPPLQRELPLTSQGPIPVLFNPFRPFVTCGNSAKRICDYKGRYLTHPLVLRIQHLDQGQCTKCNYRSCMKFGPNKFILTNMKLFG